VLVEAEIRLGDEHLGQLDHERPRKLERVSQLLLGARRAGEAGRGARDGHGLACEWRRERRARCPVDRVLEHAGKAPVVLRSGDHERICATNRVLELDDGDGIAGGLEVAVVERQTAQVVLLEDHAGGRQLGHGTQQASVVGAFPEAAGDSQKPHGR
jgi:hypothetical protein